MREYSANLVSNNKKYAIVVARFNHFITDRLLEGCLDTLKRHDVYKRQELLFVAIPHTLTMFVQKFQRELPTWV